MTKQNDKNWVCQVCGFIHAGPAAPECCPVCGAPAADFAVQEGPAAGGGPAAAPAEVWECLNCNYLHHGAQAPEVCPVCVAPAASFQAVPAPGDDTAGAPAPGAEFHLLILGGGIAGVAAAEAARQAAPAVRVTLVSKEPAPPYYRLNLTRYLAGEIRRDALPVHSPEWYAEKNIDLRLGADAVSLDPAGRRVALQDGQTVAYDKLILAMGSHPFIPSWPGTGLAGVNPLRTARDADMLLESCGRGRPVVVIGGGILGLEAAGAVARRGADVTLLEGHDWLMPRQLNARAGDLLRKHVEAAGIRLVRNAVTEELVGTEAVAAVRLADGRQIQAGVVVIATGVRPNTWLARQAGLNVNRGVVVDNHMGTSDAGILAAGDVCEHNGTVYGLWGASQYQGGIAGLNAVGGKAAFAGFSRANTLKVLGLDLVSIGEFEPRDGSYRTIAAEADGVYRLFLFRDNRLAGAILLGDTGVASAARRTVESGRDCGPLLRSNPSVAEVCDWLGSLELQ